MSRYIRGQLLMSCIIACLTFTGMWIMGVPYPLVIALLAAITEWIPVIGPIVGATGYPARCDYQSVPGFESSHFLRCGSANRRASDYASGYGEGYQHPPCGYRHCPFNRRHPFRCSRYDFDSASCSRIANDGTALMVFQFL